MRKTCEKCQELYDERDLVAGYCAACRPAVVTNLESLRQTTLDLIPALSSDRNARVTAMADRELACIEMDDDGNGPFDRVITRREADILVAEGVVRDAR